MSSETRFCARNAPRHQRVFSFRAIALVGDRPPPTGHFVPDLVLGRTFWLVVH